MVILFIFNKVDFTNYNSNNEIEIWKIEWELWLAQQEIRSPASLHQLID